MTTYIVFALPVGAPAPSEDEPYPSTAFITTKTTEDDAVEAFADEMKAEHNAVMWAIDIADMTQYVVSRSYSAAPG